MKNICKSFPGVKALQNVDFQLKSGEIHALLGENGAGKSTLIKVLGGIYIAEEGQIFIDGKQVAITGVNSARANGISIIHQELVLVPYMTVAENIFLGREPMGAFGVNKSKMSADAQKMLDRFDLGIDGRFPDRRSEHRPAADGGDRQGHLLQLPHTGHGRADLLHLRPRGQCPV